MTEVIFTVYGIPKPGGSKTAFVPTNRSTGEPFRKNGRIIVNITDASKNKEWKQAVVAAAFNAFPCEPWTCPIEVEFHFTMPRPKSHYRTGIRAAELRPDAPGMHAHAPDATKLVRSTEDALTGRLWKDDGQICRQIVSKRYGCKPGVQIVMRESP